MIRRMLKSWSNSSSTSVNKFSFSLEGFTPRLVPSHHVAECSSWHQRCWKWLVLQSLDCDYYQSEGGVGGGMTIMCLIFLFHLYRDPTSHLVVIKPALDMLPNSWIGIKHNVRDLTSHDDPWYLSWGAHGMIAECCLGLFPYLSADSGMVCYIYSM